MQFRSLFVAISMSCGVFNSRQISNNNRFAIKNIAAPEALAFRQRGPWFPRAWFALPFADSASKILGGTLIGSCKRRHTYRSLGSPADLSSTTAGGVFLIGSCYRRHPGRILGSVLFVASAWCRRRAGLRSGMCSFPERPAQHAAQRSHH